MDELIGYLIAAVVVIGIIYLIIVYVVPIILGVILIILMGFGIAGACVGFTIAIKNFYLGIMQVVADRKELGLFKDNEKKKLADGILSSTDYQDVTKCNYEEFARVSYFLKPCFEDARSIVQYAFGATKKNKLDFSKGIEWYSKIFFGMYELIKFIFVYVFGMVATLVCSAILMLISFVLMLVTYMAFGIVLGCKTLWYRYKKISHRCPVCKYAYFIPVYECPHCHIKHTALKPGKYGIFKRKCVCETKLPLTASGKGSHVILDTATNTYIKQKIQFSSMRSYCPQCMIEHNSGISRPISIALIGGAAAGKTTFKVAFLNDFLGEELINYNIDYDFPNDELEREFSEYQSNYKGRPIAATGYGINNDILTFSFFIKHKKLSTDRLIQIYDMPGEVFQSGDAKEGWNNFTFSEGAVFLLDPYTLTKVKEQNEKEIQNSSMGTSTMQMDDLIDSLINTLRQVKVDKHKGKFTIPIALTINKADTDLLKQQVGEEAINRLMAGYPDIFADRYVAMDYVCRCFLADNEGENFIANLDNNFENVHFFSCSPMGFVPKNIMTRFHPINVLPIMQWMMLRADKSLGTVWKPNSLVVDLTDEQRHLYKLHREYYEEAVEKKVIYNN